MGARLSEIGARGGGWGGWLKATADDAFRAGNAGLACAYYGAAIAATGSDERLWSNRAAAHALLGDHAAGRVGPV